MERFELLETCSAEIEIYGPDVWVHSWLKGLSKTSRPASAPSRSAVHKRRQDVVGEARH
jgi:hypothetical protein